MNNISPQTPDSYIPIETLIEDLLHDSKDGIATSTYTSSSPAKSLLEKVLEKEKNLKILKKQPIIFSPPLITRLDAPVIFRHTINVIQGQMGVHKSRFASHFASSILKAPSCCINLLDLEYSGVSPDLVVYVDTERNQREQFPRFIQEVQENAGHPIEEDPEMFRFTSLLDIPRKNRFPAVNEFLTYLRKNTDNHMIIFLDVLTDCLEDFNKVDQSLELIDFLNRMINDHDCTFFCIIHENPGQGKARGHLGTELINKASTVMQIAFEKEATGEDSDLLKIKFLKCRNSKKLPSFHAYYISDENRLGIADERDIKTVQNSRQVAAIESDVIEVLENIFNDLSSINTTELIDLLKKEFQTSEKTIQRRLIDIVASPRTLNISGKPHIFAKRKDGRESIYFITAIESADE